MFRQCFYLFSKKTVAEIEFVAMLCWILFETVKSNDTINTNR